VIRVDDHGRDLRAAVEEARKQGGGEVVLGAGVYVVPGGTIFPLVHDLSVRGEGSATKINVIGDGDVVFGTPTSGAGEMRNLRLDGFDVISPGPRTGWALRLQRCVRSVVRDVTVDPVEHGWRQTHGIWVNGFDDVTLDNVTANARVRSLLVNGMKDQSYGADLYVTGGCKFTNYRVPTDWQDGSVGIHIAGSAGGVYLTEADVIFSGIGLLIDTGVSGSQNREVFLGSGLYVDSCAHDGIYLGPRSCGSFQAVGAWTASHGVRTGSGCGMRVHHEQIPNFVGKWIGGEVFNSKGDGLALSAGAWVVSGSFRQHGGAGIRVPNKAARVLVGDSLFRANAGGHRVAQGGGVLVGSGAHLDV
jgi:hypothetical protein